VFIKELSEVVWKAAIKAAEEKFTSTNSQSVAALKVLDEYLFDNYSMNSVRHFDGWLHQRLNAKTALHT
jgi:hypothetical protein